MHVARYESPLASSKKAAARLSRQQGGPLLPQLDFICVFDTRPIQNSLPKQI